jgi:hypothetical protein
MALTLDRADEIAAAMLAMAQQHHLAAHIRVLKADNAGAMITGG